MSQHSSDSDLNSKLNDNNKNTKSESEDVYDFNEVEEELSNMNVYSDSRCSMDVISRTCSPEHSEEASEETLNTGTENENTYNTSEPNTNTNECEYTSRSSSMLEMGSSVRSDMDDSKKNMENSSTGSREQGSYWQSRRSSTLSRGLSKEDSCESYYRDQGSPSNIKSYTGFQLPQELYLQKDPIKFDIFTPSTISETNFKENTTPVQSYTANSSINDYVNNYFKEPIKEHNYKEKEKQKGKGKDKNKNKEKELKELKEQDDKSYESRDDEDSCGMYDVNMSDSEDSNSYVPGGYHPVSIGEIYNGHYKVEAKLGWGYFSTVWLASDLNEEEDKFVALKFQRSAKMYTEAVMDEIEMLNAVIEGEESHEWTSTNETYSNLLGPNYNPSNGVVAYMDHFMVEGPNGNHVCVVFEVMGPNILTLIKLYKFQGIPMDLVKKITTHVLLGLDYLHRVCKIIHTDLKPENILITSPLNLCKQSQKNKVEKENGLVNADGSTDYNNNNNNNNYNNSNNNNNKHNDNNKHDEYNNVKQDNDNNNDDDEVVQIGNKDDVIYMKNTIRPCFSDPTLITTYNDNYALQETLMRRPYHHITWNMMKTVDRNINSSYYHPSILTSIGINPFGSNKTRIKTSHGYVQIKPYTLEQFHHPMTIYKICDLGNACWINKHFTDEIQTRQYRSPEAILKLGYDNLADIWSLACVIFELVTGDYLFDPNGKESIQRDSNHIQLIVELLGPIPNYMIQNSKKSRKMSFYHINRTKRWPLESVLVKKYKMDKKEASELTNFLSCMLRINPSERQTAQQLLTHKWLTT